jgi:O-antigen/teichoic acid export membrane protein
MSLSKNTLANLTGAILPMAVLIVTVPIYLRLIGTERYGVLAVIWTLIGYFGVFDFGLSRAVTQRMARITNGSDADRSNLLWTALVATFTLGLLGGVVLWLFADFFLTHFVSISELNHVEVNDTVGWLILALPMLLPASVMQGALQGRQRFTELNANLVMGSILSQLLPLIVAASGYISLDALVPAALAARLISLFLFAAQCARYVPLRGLPVIDLSHLRPLIAYGGWISVMNMLAPILVTVDRLMIASLSGAKAVAYYSVPYNLAARVMVVSGSLSSALFPRFAEADEAEGKILAAKSTHTLVALMTPLVIFSLIFIHPFIILWVGDEFAGQSYGVAELILIGVWINSLVIPHHSRLLAADNPRIIVFIYLIQIPVYFLMLWLGLKYWGVAGAAGAWSLRVLMDTLMLLHVSEVMWPSLKRAFVPFVLVLTTVLTVLVLDPASILRWLLCLGLLIASLYLQREHLIGIVHKLLSRRKKKICSGI